MTYKVICFPSGVTNEEETDMKTLASRLDSNPFMIVATQHIESADEPYQAIRYEDKGVVQVNYLDGPKFVKADSIAAALLDEDPTDEYVLLSSKPSNWDTNYSDYYVFNDPDYVSVTGIEKTVYSPEFEQNKYYKLVEETYTLLTSEPEDWGTGTYYTSDGADPATYSEVTFTSEQITVAPEFVKNTYYKLESL